MSILPPDSKSIASAAAALSAGKLVAFPTETVYGLGAAARNREAIKRLYDAKGRPSQHPVIVHLSAIDQLASWAAKVPAPALKLAEALWPGPLTLILPKAPSVPDFVTGGQTSVGLRIPQHPVALALLREFGDGVAAPSANKFGRLSPTTASDVAIEFGDEVEFVIDGGACDVGIESTIVDFSSDAPRILRPGMITPQQIQSIIGSALASAPVHSKQEVTRAPGGLPSHYAPHTPLHVVPTAQLPAEIEQLHASGKSVCVLSFCAIAQQLVTKAIAASADPRRFSHELYANLRKLDREHADCILVEEVPQTAEWAGPADRLKRASASTLDSTH